MSIEHIRLSQQAKDQLARLKRRTGIQHWNILCRWAFCVSLAEPTIPPPAKILADSSLELAWKVFGGVYEDIYLTLLKERCKRDGLGTSNEVLATQLRLHLHRGIGYLTADRRIKDISSLLQRLPLDINAKE